MKVKSMKAFRHWFKMSKPGTKGDSWNPDYMGCVNKDSMGFFAMYHGDKEDIYGFLRKETDMAEDSQAVYEFVQNAADCNSTHFYMFYNEKYFLAINNGDQFSIEGIKSILNVGQSHGKDDDPDKIGRFGIGFKLVHRLVGKSNGLKELLEDYCGPQLFSWAEKRDFLQFVESATFEADHDMKSSSPWLMKILLTNFPASVNETVKDIEFRDRIPYSVEEFNEFRAFLKQNLSQIDQSAMNKGSMFFIKLGEDKISLLNKEQDDINNRLENTLYFLKKLTHLQVNEKTIIRQKDFIVEERFMIPPEDDDFAEIGLQEKRDTTFPILFQMGYKPYGTDGENVKGYPNFYKYFPMEDTTYGLQFILHSNVFSIGTNRRHIHEDTINKKLLWLLAKKMTERMDDHIRKGSINVYDIFANIILSECNKPFVTDNLIAKLNSYLIHKVPTDKGEFKHRDSVIIKDTSILCDPTDFGLSFSWYKWNALNENDHALIKYSKDITKLGLKSYSLKKLLEEGSQAAINSWIKNLDSVGFENFLKELNQNIPSNIAYIAFIQLEDGRFVSIRELDANTIIKFPKIATIHGVLKSLGFKLSSTDYEDYESIKYKIAEYYDYLKPDSESKLYENHLKRVLPYNTLAPNFKKDLFLCISGFKYIAEKTLANEMLLFASTNKEVAVLSKLVNPTVPGLEFWLLPFCIVRDELFEEIRSKEFLRNEHTLYNDIILPNWDKITTSLQANQASDFLKSVKKYYDLTESPNSIKSKAFIYNASKGWLGNDNTIFYHNQLITFQKYAALLEVIDNNQMTVPDKNLLGLYAQEPFTLNDTTLESLLNRAEYSPEGAVALLELCKGKINVFEHGYFSENGNTVVFSGDRSKVQYYSTKSGVHSFIADYCPEQLTALPASLNAFKENTLRDEDLYKEIISSSEANCRHSYEALNQLLILLNESELTRIVKEFIFNHPQISLTVTIDELTGSWISLINNVLDTTEIEQIRAKVYIDGIKLSELTWNNQIALENEGSIELGNILDKFNDNQVVDVIKASLLQINQFDPKKINALFQSDVEPGIGELLNIASEMLITEKNQLKNVDQLRLILYLSKNEQIEDIKAILIQAMSNEWYSIKDDWYLKKQSYINGNAVIHSNYSEIGKQSGNGFSFITKPYFHREKNLFICPHLEDKLEEDALLDFLDLVKDQINKNAQTKVSWLNQLTSSIGFIPSNKLYAAENLIVKDEELPSEVKRWAEKTPENIRILEITGVNGENSPIVQLRKYLAGETEDYSFEGFSSSNETDKMLLKNTLFWLCANEKELDESYAKTIQSITDFVGANDDISELVFPIGIAIRENALVSQLKESSKPYYINIEVAEQYKSLKIGTFTDFVRNLIDAEIDIIDPDFVSKSWLTRYCEPLSIEDREVYLEELEKSANECELEHYKTWKEQTKNDLTIKIINQSIPYTSGVNCHSELLIVSRDGDYYYDKQANILYTKEDQYINAIFTELKDYFESEELMSLLGNLSPVLNSSKERELLEKIRALEELLNSRQPNEDEELGRGGLPGDSQNDWNLEAREMLREHLKTIPEFDCSNWDDSNVPSTIIHGVLYVGRKCIWIVRSAMSQKSIFHLTPYEWNLLGEKNVFLALRTSKHNIQIYGINNDIRQIIYQNNHTINFNFDSVMLTFDGMNALANTLVHYNIWGSGLIFKNPHYSAGNSLSDLSNCKEGLAKKLSDDSL